MRIGDNLCRVKPIFHWKWGLRWIPNANEIYTKNMKCTWPTPVFCVGTQRNLYSTDWRQGLTSGKTQILALGKAKMYQHVSISNAKFWCRGHCPTPTPDARYFASQWNIGFKPIFHQNASVGATCWVLSPMPAFCVVDTNILVSKIPSRPNTNPNPSTRTL